MTAALTWVALVALVILLCGGDRWLQRHVHFVAGDVAIILVAVGIVARLWSPWTNLIWGLVIGLTVGDLSRLIQDEEYR